MKARPRRQAVRPLGAARSLILESLEDRRLLDAMPWHNPVLRLDVNNDGVTTPQDAQNLINRILSQTSSELPPPTSDPPPFYYDTNNDNRVTPNDLQRVINGLLARPTASLSLLVPYTVDVTPAVTVTAIGNAVNNAATVQLDVDVNGDGDFNDPGEMGYTASDMFNGSATFNITPELPRVNQTYTVNLRARVQDGDGVVGVTDVVPYGVDTTTSSVLEDYVNEFDPAYQYSLAGASAGQGYTFYVLDMTSQTWRSPLEVDKTVWKHWLQVYIPTGTIRDTALLLIDGGRNTNPQPELPTDLFDAGLLAQLTGSVIVHLPTVPSEPLEFADENFDRSEDAIIAYSFDKFFADPSDTDWPVLLPMVKSVVQAMDTVQDFVPQFANGQEIDDFLVTGYSKRGWTTWLTAAVDDRVRAIIPGVFDNLNQGPQMVHHFGVYGYFAEAVNDYNELEIFDRLLTAEAQQLSPITDPYRYLNNGRFDDMPKLLINSAGDEFFVSDSAQYYFDDIPGEQNFLRYLPNTGHGLDIAQQENSGVLASTLSFYDAVVNNRQLPDFSWTVGQDGAIDVHVDGTMLPTKVLLWQATNPFVRDFRNSHFTDPDPADGTVHYTSSPLSNLGNNTYLGDVAMPDSGARAYFVELTFDNPIPQMPDFVFTTEIRVKSELEFHPWEGQIDPLPIQPLGDAVPLAVPAAAVLGDSSSSAPSFATSSAPSALGAIAVALSLGSAADEPVAVSPTTLPAPLARAAVDRATSSPGDLLVADEPESLLAEAGDSSDPDLVDAVLAELDELLL